MRRSESMLGLSFHRQAQGRAHRPRTQATAASSRQAPSSDRCGSDRQALLAGRHRAAAEDQHRHAQRQHDQRQQHVAAQAQRQRRAQRAQQRPASACPAAATAAAPRSPAPTARTAAPSRAPPRPAAGRLTSQCAAILAPTMPASERGDSSSCSSAPSSRSGWNSRCSEITTASSAATQTTPGPMARSSVGVRTDGEREQRCPRRRRTPARPSASIGRREAVRTSRSMIELNAARIGKPVQVQGLRAPAGAADVAMGRHHRHAALRGVRRPGTASKRLLAFASRPAQRLVEQPQRPLAQQHARQREAPPLALRQMAHLRRPRARPGRMRASTSRHARSLHAHARRRAAQNRRFSSTVRSPFMPQA